MGFARFMASPWGRGARIVVGLALIYWGIASVGGMWGWVIAIAGLLPLALGVLNLCILGPLLGAPLKGADLPPA